MGVFNVFKLYKWYQIVQRITYDGEDDADNTVNDRLGPHFWISPHP